MKFVSGHVIDNKSALVLLMAWHQAFTWTNDNYTYRVLLSHECVNNSSDQLCNMSSLLPKPSAVNQVALTAIVILRNTWLVWTMYLCKDYVFSPY